MMCNSVLPKSQTTLYKGETIPVTRDSDGLCILKFKDGRKSIALPEVDLYSCGFIIEEKQTSVR